MLSSLIWRGSRRLKTLQKWYIMTYYTIHILFFFIYIYKFIPFLLSFAPLLFSPTFLSCFLFSFFPFLFNSLLPFFVFFYFPFNLHTNRFIIFIFIRFLNLSSFNHCYFLSCLFFSLIIISNLEPYVYNIKHMNTRQSFNIERHTFKYLSLFYTSYSFS